MYRARIVSLLVVAPLAGCVVTGALDANGGARLTFKLRLVSVAHFEQMKAALQSPDVVLRTASITPEKWATFDVECADVRKLPTAPALANTAVELTDGGDGTETLTVTLTNPAPQRLSDAFQTYIGRQFKVSLDLPGDVVSSNATLAGGRTVTWRWTTDELLPRARTELTLTYQRPRDAGTPPTTRPAR